MPDTPLTQRDIEALRVTLDKLDRTIDHLREEMSATYVRKDVYSAEREQVIALLSKHAGFFDWLWKLVGAFVILGVLALWLAQGGMVR